MIRKADEYNFRNVRRIKKQDPEGKHKLYYLDTVAAFDIETTLISKYKQSIMYIWQFQLRKTTIIGRTWDEFRRFTDRLNYSIPDDCRLVVYVHNLSYEWQFIKTIIPIDDVFAMDRRKILRVISGRIEFRCSMLHSNMSLDKFTQLHGVKHKKLHDFNYAKKRYSWTPLTPDELAYCIHDVIGLQEALNHEMKSDNDDLYTIPLTSTGYARREAKAALASSVWWIRKILPDAEVFNVLRKCFRGGNTHANRYNSNIIIEASPDAPIMSFDISSSYPAVMVSERFPDKFIKGDPSLLWLYFKHDKAILMHLFLYDVRLIDKMFGCPYISKSKCERYSGAKFDNGRILEADYIEMYITEIDFQILLMEYEFNYNLAECWIAKKKRLPKPLRELILRQYQEKTTLKGIDDYLYNKTKNKFNANFGMAVQNPVRPELVLQEDGTIIESFDKSVEELVEKYQKTGWLPYQWGVYITCYARLKLEKGLHSIPYEDFIYCDTDSIKFIGDHSAAFEELNTLYRDERFAATDTRGNVHYLGVWEPDATYMKFKTMGAKKYAYEDETGLHVTISGVNKKAGAEELKDIRNFKEGFIFRKAGGTESRYNDHPEPSHVTIQGHDVEITSNVAILNSTYQLGMTVEYKQLIKFLSSGDIRFTLHYER